MLNSQNHGFFACLPCSDRVDVAQRGFAVVVLPTPPLKAGDGYDHAGSEYWNAGSVESAELVDEHDVTGNAVLLAIEETPAVA
jgi:hypothetical protein